MQGNIIWYLLLGWYRTETVPVVKNIFIIFMAVLMSMLCWEAIFSHPFPNLRMSSHAWLTWTAISLVFPILKRTKSACRESQWHGLIIKSVWLKKLIRGKGKKNVNFPRHASHQWFCSFAKCAPKLLNHLPVQVWTAEIVKTFKIFAQVPSLSFGFWF